MPVKKHKFKIINSEETNSQNRFYNISSDDIKKNKKFYTILAAITIITISIITIGILYNIKKDKFEKLNNTSHDKILTDDLKIPSEGEDISQNIHILKGQKSFFNKHYSNALTEFNKVLESDASDDDKALALMYIGIIYDHLHHYEDAIKSFQRALKYKKDDVDILKNLTLTYKHNNNLSLAFKTINKALDISPDNTELLTIKGNILFEMGHFKESLLFYQKALNLKPDNPKLLYNIALNYLKQGDLLQAEEYFKKAAFADKGYFIKELSYSQLAAHYISNNNFKLAEKYLNLALELNPDNPINLYNAGIINIKKGNYKKAIEYLNKAKDAGLNNQDLFERMANAYELMGLYEDSIDILNKLNPIKNNNVQIMLKLAQLYYKSGNLDKAFELYTNIVSIQPGTHNAFNAYLNMANIMIDKRNYPEAIEYYKKALQINNTDSKALYNLGLAYKLNDQPELAISVWEKAAKTSNDPKSLIAIAKLHYERGFVDRALSEYIHIVRNYPENQEAQFELGLIYFNKGQYDFALNSFERAIAINDKNELGILAMINSAIILSKSNDDQNIEKAFKYLNKVLSLKPNYSKALIVMGDISYNKRQYHKAIEIYMQALETSNDDKTLSTIYGNIGKCYYKLKEFKKSLQYFTKAIEYNPSNETLRINRKAAMEAYEKELEM